MKKNKNPSNEYSSQTIIFSRKTIRQLFFEIIAIRHQNIIHSCFHQEQAELTNEAGY
jgi:predicted lipase